MVDYQKGVYPNVIHNNAVLFGDLFGSRGEYNTGVFYSGRNRYLHNSSDANVLLAPSELTTRRQARTQRLLQQQGVLQMQKMEFISKKNPDETQINGKNKKLETVTKKKMRVVVQKFSSYDKADWIEQNQAGCKFWKNIKSGEVSYECPWEEEDQEIKRGEGASATKASGEHPEDEFEVDKARALLYDGDAMEELMALLDQVQAQSPSKARQPLQK